MSEPTNEELRTACEPLRSSFSADVRDIVAALLSRLDREAEAERRADELRALKPGWDSYGAPAISEAAIRSALAFCRGRLHLSPSTDGGVQIDGFNGELVFGPGGDQQFDDAPLYTDRIANLEAKLAEAERRLKVAREAARQAAIKALESAVLLSQVAPSSSITVKESDRLDAAVEKMRWVSRALAEIAPAAPEGPS